MTPLKLWLRFQFGQWPWVDELCSIVTNKAPQGRQGYSFSTTEWEFELVQCLNRERGKHAITWPWSARDAGDSWRPADCQSSGHSQGSWDERSVCRQLLTPTGYFPMPQLSLTYSTIGVQHISDGVATHVIDGLFAVAGCMHSHSLYPWCYNSPREETEYSLHGY